jgi:hypothetical protein
MGESSVRQKNAPPPQAGRFFLLERRVNDLLIAVEFLCYLWEANKSAILYLAWLLQTWYMTGMIVK